MRTHSIALSPPPKKTPSKARDSIQTYSLRVDEPSTGMAAILCARCLPGSLSDYEDDCRDMTIPDSIEPSLDPTLE